jgi:hypothetical protein
MPGSDPALSEGDGRDPLAAGVVILLVGWLVVFGVFLTLLRSLDTHIGVVVCLRGDRATDAVRFSYLHFKAACDDGQVALTPAETSIAADRKAYGGEFVRGADQQDEPTPREDRLALSGTATASW